MEWKMHDRKTNVIDFSGIVLIEMKRLMYAIRVNWGSCPDGFQMFFGILNSLRKMQSNYHRSNSKVETNLNSIKRHEFPKICKWW